MRDLNVTINAIEHIMIQLLPPPPPSSSSPTTTTTANIFNEYVKQVSGEVLQTRGVQVDVFHGKETTRVTYVNTSVLNNKHKRGKIFFLCLNDDNNSINNSFKYTSYGRILVHLTFQEKKTNR